MHQTLCINGEAVAASQEGTLVIELFLNDNYRCRRNILNGKVEFLTLPESEDKGLFIRKAVDKLDKQINLYHYDLVLF